MRLASWIDLIETPPQNGYKTFRPGAHHYAIVVRIPYWLAAILHRVLPDEKDLQPCRPV